ncbi:unnamed protein product (macronuclear) [Paramecium tetraurelia]|uniref:Trichohyalin-plectin-homology domain-containing protein n=1 Tax=Paramecium tetraurelia TaxID=5888 RepID=A0CYZ8_PARTE|nr:uncharacterized protein GSPATT00011616001 [Paramecium tetraurelia]CAK76015.1 unnamed protein product [Paramecium tetraurelia]|eukprot:XP_001443412.1 hypothetical protein (macronuclear) [Paramecium tetraurelia strain d4-2]
MSTVTNESKKKESIDKALLQQQREQLKQTVLERFIKDFGKNNKNKIQIITNIVNEYFSKTRVTDVTLKNLKQQVQQAIQNAGSTTQSQAEQSIKESQVTQQQQLQQIPQQKPPSSQSRKSNQQMQTAAQQHHDVYSETSSKAPKSVYMMEGDEDDEWATLVKFDTELYKKEKELELIRKQEFKKKIKSELDRQINEKQGKKHEEVQDEDAYVKLHHYQLNVYDQREKDKQDNLKNKIYNEKLQRDKQVRDEQQRKKVEQKREKELDSLLVKKIREELELEQREQLNRRNKERERFLRMMKENEEYRKKALEDAKLEKEAETQMQQQYISLQNQLEEQRELERKQREDKMKKVMGMFAEGVVRDQKELIKQEDDKMLRNIIQQNDREKIEEEKKKLKQLDQRQQLRSFLNSQIEEKKRRQEEEEELNKRQAEIWKQDLDNYNDHERKKFDYIKEVNLRHADILKSQIQEKQGKIKQKSTKMNTAELLQNKDKLKVIAQEVPDLGDKVKKIEI